MNKILIVGGGTSGFVSALILKKRFPKLIIDIVNAFSHPLIQKIESHSQVVT
jgi:protoporphyrinogen oxidase